MSWVGWIVMTAAVSVPPDAQPANNNQPFHDGSPVIRRFERRPDDDYRRRSWEAYVREIDLAWTEYRKAGSTTQAWRIYQRALGVARREYIYRDIYYAPVVDRPVDYNRSYRQP